MKFSIGDKIMIKADVEELQNVVIEMVDGSTGTISEIYRNSYEPDVDRFEVELDQPVEYNGETIRVVPGLYKDNIERLDKREKLGRFGRTGSSELTERYVMFFSDLLGAKNRKF